MTALAALVLVLVLAAPAAARTPSLREADARPLAQAEADRVGAAVWASSWAAPPAGGWTGGLIDSVRRRSRLTLDYSVSFELSLGGAGDDVAERAAAFRWTVRVRRTSSRTRASSTTKPREEAITP